MAEFIEVVIKIDEATYKHFMTNEYSRIDVIAIHNALNYSTPLPKGHGRLVDADELYLDIQTDEEMRLGEENLLWVRERIYDVAPTIIERDKE